MKIRQGFVSNSSSSSFCIIGTDTDLDDFVKHIIKTFPSSISTTSKDVWAVHEEIQEIVTQLTGLDCTIDSESELVYIGYNLPNDSLYDRTINELIEEVKQKITILQVNNKFFNSPVSLDTFEICS